MTPSIRALLVPWLALPGLAPGAAWAARTVQPPPSGIVIHLFGNNVGKQVQPGGTTGTTVTTQKGATPVSLGFAHALARMLNNSGTPTGLTGRAANLPPLSVPQNERHPGT